jgi:hypothetical protein
MAVRMTIKAMAPFGAEMYRPNLFVAICRRLAAGRLRAADFRYSHHTACRNPILPDFIEFWRLAWRAGGSGARWRRHCYS